MLEDGECRDRVPRMAGKEADAFTKVMKEYGQVKSDEQRSYTITDGDFRLEVKSKQGERLR